MRSPGKKPNRVKEPAAAFELDAKVAKSYRLSPKKIADAQKILGSKTATSTIETALDMVVFRHELVEGTAALLGVDVTDFADQ